MSVITTSIYARRVNISFVLSAIAMSWLFSQSIQSGEEASSANILKIPSLPQGASLGMSIEDLKKARPDAKEFNLGKALGETPKTQRAKDAVLSYMEKQVDNQETMSASYLFDNEKCVAISVARYTAWSNFVNIRKQVLQEYLTQFGHAFKKMRRIVKGFQVNYDTPALVWIKEGVQIVISVTPNFSEVSFNKGEIFIAVTGIEKDGKPRFDLGLEKNDGNNAEWLFQVVDTIQNDAASNKSAK